jgi:hypothetical protein
MFSSSSNHDARCRNRDSSTSLSRILDLELLTIEQ